MAWIYGTDWIRRLGNGIADKYNDGVEVTAMAIAPIVNPIAEGRSMDAAKYLVNKTPLGVAASPIGAALLYDSKFEVKKEDEYTPEVYQKAAKIMARGVSEHATQEQIDQARAESHAANVEVQQKTADYQAAAIDIATLPAWALMGPATEGATSFRLLSSAAAKESSLLAGRTGLGWTAARVGMHLQAPMVATDMGARYVGNAVFNHATHGRSPEQDSTAARQAQEAHINAANARAQKAQEEEIAIYKVLDLDPNGNFTDAQFLAALDRNKDGVLKKDDAESIRAAIGNPELADRFLRTLREDMGITFDNQPLAGMIASVDPNAGRTGNEQGFFSKLWVIIVSMFTNTVNFFSSALPQTTAPVSTRPAHPSENQAAQLPINHGLSSQAYQASAVPQR